LDLLILKTLTVGALHGYAIAQRIQQRSDDVLVVEEGSLYPALYRMEEKGWISAEWGKSENNRRAKYYSLTRAGRKQLEEEVAIWERVRRAINLVLETA
jgi:transcriptional regulator